jgi:hypothetical protein
MMRRLAMIGGLVCFAQCAAHAEGPGWKLGESLVLHPAFAVGAGIDSNVFYAQSGHEVAGGYIDLRPSIDLATPSVQRGGGTPHTLDFRLHLGGDLRFLLPVGANSASFTGHNSYNADGGFALALFPFGNYAFDLFGNYVRLSQTPYLSVGGDNINSDTAQVGLRLRLRPGGQRLEIGIQDVVTMLFFEGGYFTAKNDIINDAQLRLSWKFFPKTALYLAANSSPIFYVNNAGAATPPNAYPFRIVAGVIGLITPTLSVNVNIGYANYFSTGIGANSYNSAIALVEGTWKPTLVTSLSLGYKHDFMNALIGTFYTIDSPYLAFTQGIWRFTLLLHFRYEHRSYVGDLTADGFCNGSTSMTNTHCDDTIPGERATRSDDLIAGHLEIDFPIKDWLIIAVGDDLQKNFSNCHFSTAPNLPPSFEPTVCDYLRNDVWLRIGVAY